MAAGMLKAAMETVGMAACTAGRWVQVWSYRNLPVAAVTLLWFTIRENVKLSPGWMGVGVRGEVHTLTCTLPCDICNPDQIPPPPPPPHTHIYTTCTLPYVICNPDQIHTRTHTYAHTHTCTLPYVIWNPDQIHTHARARAHTHTHLHSPIRYQQPRPNPHTHTHTYTHTCTLPYVICNPDQIRARAHTHTHTHTHTLALSHTLSATQTKSTRTSHTHTHTLSHTLSAIQTKSALAHSYFIFLPIFPCFAAGLVKRKSVPGVSFYCQTSFQNNDRPWFQFWLFFLFATTAAALQKRGMLCVT